VHMVELLPENHDVWEFFWDAELLGYEVATTFHHIVLTRYEADLFFEKFKLLKTDLEKWRAEEAKKNAPSSANHPGAG